MIAGMLAPIFRPLKVLLLLVMVAAACESNEPPRVPAAVASVTQVDSPTAPTDSAAFDWRAQLGRVELDPDRVLCLVAARGSVSAGDSLWLVSDGMDSQQIEKGVAGAPGACGAFRNDLEEVFPVTLLSPSPESAPVRIAILGYDDPVQVRDRLAVADLDRDGRPEFFGFCTSMEGVHLTVWTGQVAKGVRRWHKYHPLLYDVEPSCTEAEMSEPYERESPDPRTDSSVPVFSDRVAVFMEAAPEVLDSILSTYEDSDREIVGDDVMYYRSAAYEFFDREGIRVVRLDGRPPLRFEIGGAMREFDFAAVRSADVIVLYDPGKAPRAIAPLDLHLAQEYFGLDSGTH